MRGAVCKVQSYPNAIVMLGGIWDSALFRFFVLASDSVPLSELGLGLSHFDQQGFVGLVRTIWVGVN